MIWQVFIKIYFWVKKPRNFAAPLYYPDTFVDPHTYILVAWILKKYVCFTDVWHQRRQSCYNRWCKNVSKKIATRIYQRKLLWTPKIAKKLHKIYIILVNIWIITLKMANFKGWFFARKLRGFFSKMWLFLGIFNHCEKSETLHAFLKNFDFSESQKPNFNCKDGLYETKIWTKE